MSKIKSIIGMFMLILLSGCVADIYQNEFDKNQLKINAYLIDNTNIDRLNECTKLSSCDGWKCLCNTMVSENDYCQRYEDFCVKDICKEITKNINGVNFMQSHFGDDRYSGCIFVYNTVVEIYGIEMLEIREEILICLSDYRNNKNLSNEDISIYQYKDGRFFDEEMMLIKC